MSKTLEISDETYEKIKAQLTADELIDISTLDDLVGQKLFIRTVTYHKREIDRYKSLEENDLN